MIRKLHPVAAPLAPAAAAAATARTPAAEGAAPPADHRAHPLTVTLPHAHAPDPALIRAARAAHVAATDSILRLAATALALAHTALLPRVPPTADATIAAVLLHLPTATPDAPGVLHPDPAPALAAALRSTGGEVGLWGGTGAVSPAHPRTSEHTEAGLAAMNALPSASAMRRRNICWMSPKQMLPGFWECRI